MILTIAVINVNNIKNANNLIIEKIVALFIIKPINEDINTSISGTLKTLATANITILNGSKLPKYD